MQELDKSAMGGRIRQIRLQAGLRQWELARLLGTTQSAVHKYEHGVVPEPRRLIELARVGRTSIEWILTGRHWENGSEVQERLSPELLRTAHLLRQVGSAQRPSVDEALRIVRAAVEALAPAGPPGTADPPLGALRTLSTDTLRVLETAWRIQQAVVRTVLEDATERLSSAPVAGNDTPESLPGGSGRPR